MVALLITNMKPGRLVAATVAIGVLVVIGFGLYALKKRDNHQSPLGLKLVAKYEPLGLCIYANTASTNKNPDYLITEGNQNLLYRGNAKSNTIETTYFENGAQVFFTRRNDKSLLERSVTHNDDQGQAKLTYIDRDGDGLWDVFIDQTKGFYYVRSNLSWVLRAEATNQAESGPSPN